jgi:hypothetical protein
VARGQRIVERSSTSHQGEGGTNMYNDGRLSAEKKGWTEKFVGPKSVSTPLDPIILHITGCEGVVTLLGPTNFSVHHFFFSGCRPSLSYIPAGPCAAAPTIHCPLLLCEDDESKSLSLRGR